MTHLFYLFIFFWREVPRTSTNIKLSTAGFLLNVWREHALQSGQHASYTENERDATAPAMSHSDSFNPLKLSQEFIHSD